MGIPLALAGAVFMSFGAQYQHRGVAKVERIQGETGASGLSLKLLLSLLRRPSWIVGTIMLGLAIVCQLGALAVAAALGSVPAPAQDYPSKAVTIETTKAMPMPVQSSVPAPSLNSLSSA